MKPTPRKGISHGKDMSPLKFLRWIRLNDPILKDIPCFLKVDGLAGRFGRDEWGNIFLEGARTGPQYNPENFVTYTKQKTDSLELIARAEHYGNLLSLFKSLEWVNNLDKDVKIVCEILYTPLACINERGVRFVTVDYDSSLLGELLTILPYTVLSCSTGETHPNKEKILKQLYKNSHSTIKIINPQVSLQPLDIRVFVESLNDIDESVLISRKKQNIVQKEKYKTRIKTIQKQFFNFIYEEGVIEGRYKLGNNLEGIVLWIDGKEYKIIDPHFLIFKK